LHWAAATEQPAIVHLLLAAGASHDIQTNQEETALSLGAREGSTEVCHLLLSAGANPEIADHLDRTPRQIAAQNGSPFSRSEVDSWVNFSSLAW
uniref:ANK_REP_REGION domain-containing protein n=1 Tax=Schistocephalus solidus TaxID=70667 RepID=A0A183SZG2_SCHSO